MNEIFSEYYHGDFNFSADTEVTGT